MVTWVIKTWVITRAAHLVLLNFPEFDVVQTGVR